MRVRVYHHSKMEMKMKMKIIENNPPGLVDSDDKDKDNVETQLH
jgi:hypothetical protein